MYACVVKIIDTVNIANMVDLFDIVDIINIVDILNIVIRGCSHDHIWTISGLPPVIKCDQ